ncbi:MAG TPA: hypothetical protein VIL04_06920 [Solirubrobacterales bacterium]
MRDLVLKEALQTMAADAALRFRELLAAGEEIPYDVREAGNGSPLAEYTPQTARFIRDHLTQLQGIDSFGAACAALEAAELAGPYLESHGVPVPPDSRVRAQEAGLLFLCRLWQGSTDFTLDDTRMAAAIEEISSLADAREDEVDIIVPLRGFQMDADRLRLDGVTIVRSDIVDVPAEARAPEGMGAAAWEPTFIACARIDLTTEDGADLSARAVETFRRLITTLRLFKTGGVALAPHAWVRAGNDRWRRIATGAGKPRPGGYRIGGVELAELSAFARALAGPSTPFARARSDKAGFPGVLGRALSRFEAGLERNLVIEGLNDHLLALRFLLEGGGPAQLGLSMRVAALCAEPHERGAVKEIVDRALAIERELWSGEPAPRDEELTPADVAAELEELLRAILRDAACGHLGSDLRATADEILLAEGLAVGEGSPAQRGGTTEWQLGEVPADLDLAALEAEADNPALGETQEVRVIRNEDAPDEDAGDAVTHEWAAVGEAAPEELDVVEEPLPAEDYVEPEPVDPTLFEDEDVPAAEEPAAEEPAAEESPAEEPAPVGEPFPDPEPVDPRDWGLEPEWEPIPPRPAVAPRAQNKIHEVELAPEAERAEREEAPAAREEEAPQEHLERLERDDRPTRVLRAVPDESPVMRLIEDSTEHQREVADRVAYLFPRPETCEWNVPEVGYDRRRRAQVDHPVPHAS